MTPVLIEAFISLQNLIIQQDAYALEKNKQTEPSEAHTEMYQSFPEILCLEHPPRGPNSI
jgi:hypothetical protein